jgi:hypothetical protein
MNCFFDGRGYMVYGIGLVFLFPGLFGLEVVFKEEHKKILELRINQF